MTTNHDLIHKLARAIDPLAFAPEATPTRFANAIIEAEVAFEIVWDEAVEACLAKLRDCLPFMLENDATGDGFREAVATASQAIEALKRSPPNKEPF